VGLLDPRLGGTFWSQKPGEEVAGALPQGGNFEFLVLFFEFPVSLFGGTV
jgi:hypothetical protein